MSTKNLRSSTTSVVEDEVKLFVEDNINKNINNKVDNNNINKDNKDNNNNNVNKKTYAVPPQALLRTK